MVKNLPASVRGTSSISGPGRFLLPVCHNYRARGPESLFSVTGEATAVRRLLTANGERLRAATETQRSQK